MNSEQVYLILLARQHLYNLFHYLLGNEPTRELLEAAFSNSSIEALELFCDIDLEYANRVEQFKDNASSFANDSEGFLIRLASDYTRLFVGPHSLKAPPWECVYITKERLLFQESTLKVRETYRKEGYLPSDYPRVSDDHISLELDFMALVAKRCNESFRLNDFSEWHRLLEVQLGFLKEHLLKWIPRYSFDLEKAAPESLYSVLAVLAAVFCQFDEKTIRELTEEAFSTN